MSAAGAGDAGTRGARVLVFGARGELGHRIVRRLLAEGFEVRAASRNPDACAARIARRVEVVEADLRDAASVRSACDGMSHVVSTANGYLGRAGDGPRAVDDAGHANLAAAARAAGVVHLTYVSATPADPRSPLDFFRAKAAAERHVAGSGVSHAIVRPTAFIETFVAMAREAAAGGAFPLVGGGRVPLAFIGIDEVASYAVRCVADAHPGGRVLAICGHEAIDLATLVARIGRALGRNIATRSIPVVAARALAALLAPVDPVMARKIRTGVVAAAPEAPIDMAAVTRAFAIEPVAIDTAIARALSAASSGTATSAPA